ncbi:MAG: response regulator transcription factor [Lachnospiraceae bacterium]|nr:response regulator transcription factor [Lachnospiraceae bacterium]
MKTIAVIDDDLHIGNMLEEVLAREGYRTLRAYSGTEALFLLEREHPDLLLLDLMLPGLSGEEVLKKISGIPVIILSAKADVPDKVSLLLGGASDYMTKPFDTRELLARIAVQLRNASSASSGLLTFGALALDTQARSATLEEVPVHLTKTEYAILKLLMQNPGQVLTKSLLLERISPDTPDCTELSLKIHVSNLRKKLKHIDGKDHIEAVWGIGFRLR